MLRKALKLKSTNTLETLTERQLSELLYRDDLVLKHSAGSCIKDAVKQVADASTTARTIHMSEGAEGTLVAALIEFLIEAGLGVRWQWQMFFQVCSQCYCVGYNSITMATHDPMPGLLQGQQSICFL